MSVVDDECSLWCDKVTRSVTFWLSCDAITSEELPPKEDGLGFLEKSLHIIAEEEVDILMRDGNF